MVHHLNCGIMRPRWPVGVPKLICHCLLVESADRLILVDTGIGQDDVNDPLDRFGVLVSSLMAVEQDPTRTAFRQLRALGFDPHDVRDIVMTHLDFDCTGGLPDFPWATVHALDLEQYAALHARTAIERNRYCQAHFAHGPEWSLHVRNPVQRWFGFEMIRPLPNLEPDLLMIPLLGHSRGHCGAAVREAGGWTLHAGDAFMCSEELDAVEPRAPVGLRAFEKLLADDWNQVVANQALIRQLAHERYGEVQVVCSHDAEMIDLIPPVPCVLNGRAYAR